jgi:tetratricopeptide (TPR) repeat protein
MKENEPNAQDGNHSDSQVSREYPPIESAQQNGNNGAPLAKTASLSRFQNRVRTAFQRVSTPLNRPGSSNPSKISPLLAGGVLGLSIALLLTLCRPLTTPPATENRVSEQRQTVSEDWFQQAYEDSRKGNHQAAIANYTQAIQRAPKNPNFYYNRGIEYAAIGDRPAAINDYTQAIQLDKNFADAFYNRANLHAAEGKKNSAIADYQSAAKLYQQQGLKDYQQEAIDSARRLQQSTETEPQ